MNFTIDKYYKIKHESKEYPWPCQGQLDRTIELFDDDVLTKSDDGTFMKHTGIGCFNIKIPDEDVIFVDKPIHLTMM